MSQPSSSKGWTVMLSGTAINLALGVLYSWSVIAKAIKAPVAEHGWGWTATQTQLPYAVACGVFAIIMVFAGRAQDKIGPRVVASLGGALVGIGMILSSFATAGNGMLLTIGFGILVGAGIGLGYASATPPAIKWFPPAKRGMVSGIVVAGFGLASVYIAPMTTSLLKAYGINQAFLLLGVGFFFVTVLFSQLLKNPPAGYIPAGMTTTAAAAAAASGKKHDYDWHEMVKTPQFYLLWIMFAFGAAAGLLTIGSLAGIVSTSVAGTAKDAATLARAAQWSFIMVAILAIANAGGRVIAGFMSDIIGRIRTMMIVFLLQAVMMFLFPTFSGVPLLILGAVLIGFSYGALLSVFPSTTGDYFGTKNLGINYGLVFTAWGFGGVFGPIMAGMIKDATGSFQLAFQIAAGLCILAALLTFVTKAPKTVMVESPVKAVLEPEM
ncbi:MAG: L-lactate MFS transporter [Candidatus Aquicultor sp.]